ncbi:MAG: DUF2029 domain-containing protein [Clostridiales bacterium]|nr:DUF2029 domain-containing protein [Clostridiales bacterium]
MKRNSPKHNLKLAFEIFIYVLAIALVVAMAISIWNQRETIVNYYYEKTTTANSDTQSILDPADLYEGKGTETSPYCICTIEDLELLRDVIESGNSCKGVYFGQTEDLDMEGIDSWSALSPASGTVYFAGVYDGKGYKISNLQINKEDDSLFGVISGTIQNLQLEDVIVSSQSGSILVSRAADSTGFKIVNCLITYENDIIENEINPYKMSVARDASYGMYLGCYILEGCNNISLFSTCSDGSVSVIACYSSGEILEDWDELVQYTDSYDTIDLCDEDIQTQINDNLYNFRNYSVLGKFNQLGTDTNGSVIFTEEQVSVLDEEDLMAYQKFIRNIAIYLIAMLVCCLLAYIIGRLFHVSVNKTAIYIILAGTAGIFILFGIHTRGSSIIALLYDGYQNGQLKVFTDFFDLLIPGFDPYTTEITASTSIYPPLVSLLFACMSLLIPEAVLENSILARNSQVGSLLYVFWTIFEFILLYELIKKYKKGCNFEKIFFFVLFCMTFPVIHTVERGNVSLLCAICMAFYLYNYDNERYIVRQLSFVALSIAAGFKLYPAILGILLIRKKQYKDVLNCLAYGISINLIPSLFLHKGLASFAYMFINATSYVEGNAFVGGKIDLYHIINIPGQIMSLANAIDPSEYYSIIRLILIVLTVFVVLFSHLPEWKIQTVLVLGIIMLGTFSPFYYLPYLLAPMMMFLDIRNNKPGQLVYVLLWSGMFMLFATNYKYPFALQAPNQSIWNMTIIEGFCALAFELLLLAEGVGSIILTTAGKLKRSPTNACA